MVRLVEIRLAIRGQACLDLTITIMPLQSTLSRQGKGLCLLSLDAGGTRSISQLKILAELMHQLNFDVTEDQKLRPCDVFDMIGGSGSGGFIAILLVILGLSADQALDEFIEFSVNILEKQGVDAEARTAELKVYIDKLLEKYHIEKDTRLLDPDDRSKGSKLVIPILPERHIGHARVLRNFDASQDQILNVTIAEAMLATLASPPLFTSVSILSGTSMFEYISGDLTLSNPTRLIISETHEAFGGDQRVACVLSIGCGHPGIIIAPEKSDLETWNQFLEKSVRDSEQRADEIESQMGHLGLFHRFSVTRGLERGKDVPTVHAGDVITHTMAYLASVSGSQKVAMCVDSLKARDGVASLEQLGELRTHKVDTGVHTDIAHSGGQRVEPPTLPPLTRTFVMRKKPWEFMEKAILGTNDSEDIEGPRMLAVTGMGGCGKTQLVLKFLQVHRQRFELCLFIDGSSTPRIRADVVRHVRSLGIAHSQKTFEDCLIFLSRPALAGQRIIVYDNVDDPGLDLAPLLPTGESCAIIVTSQNRLIGGLCPGSHLELDVMSLEEAIDLLLYSADHSIPIAEESRREARAIAKVMGCLPIALQQARSYMSQTKCSARAYLDRFIEDRDRLLAEPAKFQLDMAAVSTYAAFKTSFKKLALRSQKFLWLLCHFHRDKFPLELVMLAAKFHFSEYRLTYTDHGEDFHRAKAVLEGIFLQNDTWDMVNLDKIMIDLQNYSLITSLPGVDTTLIQMHPLAHRWVQSYIPEHEASPYESAAILLLALGSRDEHTPSAQYLASHVIHMSTFWDQLHINNAEAFAEILNRGGSFEGSLKLRERVATELRNQLEPDSLSIARSGCALALSYRSAGRSKDAEPLQQQALKILTDILGEQHTDTIAASNDLALTYFSLGRLKDVEVMQEKVLKLRKETLGERHPETINASHNLANTYSDLGRLKDAELLQEEVLELRKEILGERHPDTLTTSNNLAITYYDMGRLKDAELLWEEVLKVRKEILGERHPDTITASNNLALTYRDLGRLKDAELLQEEVLKLLKEILGERHPETITASGNLANTYGDLGRLKDAELLREEVLRLRKEILGERHPDTIAASSGLAITYDDLGRVKDAELLHEEVLKLRKEILGERHPETITASSNLALTYCDLGRLKDAELLQEEVLKLRKEILGEHHPDTIVASNNLAITYHNLGRLNEAEALQLETVRQAQDLFGNEHPTTALSMITMAEIYQSVKKATQALSLLDSAELIITEKLGRDHPHYAMCQRTRVLALQYSPLHATGVSPPAECASIDTPPSSQNALHRSIFDGVGWLAARVREQLS